MLLQITSTAGGGTLTLEFGILSRLTNNTGKCDISLCTVLMSALIYYIGHFLHGCDVYLVQGI